MPQKFLKVVILITEQQLFYSKTKVIISDPENPVQSDKSTTPATKSLIGIWILWEFEQDKTFGEIYIQYIQMELSQIFSNICFFNASQDW